MDIERKRHRGVLSSTIRRIQASGHADLANILSEGTDVRQHVHVSDLRQLGRGLRPHRFGVASASFVPVDKLRVEPPSVFFVFARSVRLVEGLQRVSSASAWTASPCQHAPLRICSRSAAALRRSRASSPSNFTKSSQLLELEIAILRRDRDPHHATELVDRLERLADTLLHFWRCSVIFAIAASHSPLKARAAAACSTASACARPRARFHRRSM